MNRGVVRRDRATKIGRMPESVAPAYRCLRVNQLVRKDFRYVSLPDPLLAPRVSTRVSMADDLADLPASPPSVLHRAGVEAGDRGRYSVAGRSGGSPWPFWIPDCAARSYFFAKHLLNNYGLSTGSAGAKSKKISPRVAKVGCGSEVPPRPLPRRSRASGFVRRIGGLSFACHFDSRGFVSSVRTELSINLAVILAGSASFRIFFPGEQSPQSSGCGRKSFLHFT